MTVIDKNFEDDAKKAARRISELKRPKAGGVTDTGDELRLISDTGKELRQSIGVDFLPQTGRRCRPDVMDDLPPNDPPASARIQKPSDAQKNIVPLVILPSEKFVEGFVPPDYLIRGILQRRYFYSLTAHTGGGKTALMLRLGAHVALGLPIGDIHVEKGNAMYLAGENPDDLRMRWLCMADEMEFDVSAIPVNFISGSFNIRAQFDDLVDRIEQQAIGDLSVVLVDTSVAFFLSDAENENIDMLKHAKMLRTLTLLPGGPTVIAACHPAKNASQDNLVPRGGGAFVNETDGNLVCKKREGAQCNGFDMHHQVKFRGVDFAPIGFELKTVSSTTVKDSDGRLIPSVMAVPISDARRSEIEKLETGKEDELLGAMLVTPNATLRGLASILRWEQKDGKPYITLVRRTLAVLHKAKLVKKARRKWVLTEAGREEAKTSIQPAPLSPFSSA